MPKKKCNENVRSSSTQHNMYIPKYTHEIYVHIPIWSTKKNIIKSQVCWCKHILEMSYTGWVGYDGNIGICVHILQWLLSSENSKTYFTYSLNLCVCIPPATDDSFRFSSVPVTANDLMRRMKCGKWNFFSLCRLPKKSCTGIGFNNATTWWFFWRGKRWGNC